MSVPSSKQAIFYAAGANIAIALAKFVGAGLTGSAAMMAEGVHSLVDTGNQILLLVGMARSKRPPDRHHPLGYGGEVYFYGLLVAMLIFMLGATVAFYEGVEKILAPHSDAARAIMLWGRSVPFSWIVLGILGFSMVAEGWSLRAAYRAFVDDAGGLPIRQAIRSIKDPTVLVLLFEDAAAVVGLAVAFIGIGLADLLDRPWIDGLASVLIGCVLSGTSFFLAATCKNLLIGSRATDAVEAEIRAIVADHPGIERINEILTVHVGPDDILVAISLDFSPGLSSSGVEAVVSHIERTIKAAIADVDRVFIEAQSWRAHLNDLHNAANR